MEHLAHPRALVLDRLDVEVSNEVDASHEATEGEWIPEATSSV